MTNTTTKGVLFPAQSNSEWDSVDALFMPIEMAEKIIVKAEKLIPIVKENGLFYAAVLDDSPTFILTEKIDEESETPILAELTKEELCNTPENRLKTYTTKYFYSENVTIQCYGEHSGEEFWAEIDLTILKQLIS